MSKQIIIRGANENNLKNISLKIPKNKLVVFTGLSGSGKTSLAFDTIYAEGQRRYIESLSAYARQFLGQMNKPDVEYIEGLSPAISIDQKTTNRNPRSTVGTVTEIYDYLRLLYARIGIAHCPSCGKEITSQSIDMMMEDMMSMPEGQAFYILAPVVKGQKGQHKKLLENLKKSGYVRVLVDKEMYDINEVPELDKNIKHTIEVVVDRLKMKDSVRSRLADSVQNALHLSDGIVICDILGQERRIYSEKYACPDCNISLEKLEPRDFSFNTPFGACEKCSGLGMLFEVDEDMVVKDKTLSLSQGAIDIAGWNFSKKGGLAFFYMEALVKEYGIDIHMPYEKLDQKTRNILMYGTGDKKINVQYVSNSFAGEFNPVFEGIIPTIKRRYHQTQSMSMKKYYQSFMHYTPCPLCKGDRLKESSRHVTVGGKNIIEFTKLSIDQALAFIENLVLSEKEKTIATQVLAEIKERLTFLINVGLEYLTLFRSSASLSGGESQRIRLATQIGSGLTGVLYVLDEPSIGLHQRDNRKLLDTLRKLVKLDNTLIVVEHDEETMYEADYIVDIGPGAGIHGGQVVAAGTVEKIKSTKKSITGQYLSGAKKIAVPKKRAVGQGKEIKIIGARENNLKNIDVTIPLGIMTLVTGVSGSGKSTLINEILYKGAAKALYKSNVKPGAHDAIIGLEHIDKVIEIDQSPIGRTPRSNPATYTGVFDDIRNLFASTNEAKMRGFNKGHFSFNVKGGRCESCMGDGVIKVEMHFLSDVYVECEVCKGKRYNHETLSVHYKGKNIADVLNMTAEEALDFFQNIPPIRNRLQILNDVGLSYVKLGQSSTTLSGGEAQRIKLAYELSKRATGKTLYLLDEPTTGLHADDVNKLLKVLQRLKESGNTVIIIEHNLDMIKCADYIIDMGPEGGDRGGEVIATGTPEEIMQNTKSYTGQYLKKVLKSH